LQPSLARQNTPIERIKNILFFPFFSYLEPPNSKSVRVQTYLQQTREKRAIEYFDFWSNATAKRRVRFFA